MRWVASLALTGVVVVLANADEPEKTAVEKALAELNRAFETRDANVLRRLMTPEHIAVTPYYGGPFTREQIIKNLPETKFEQYAAGAMKFTALDKGAVLITYPLTMKGTYHGKAVATRNFASAIWIKTSAGWRETFYQETALE